MYIILGKLTRRNQDAIKLISFLHPDVKIQFYPDIDLSKIKDTHLVLLDTDGFVQNYLSPSVLADLLLNQFKLNESQVKSIELLFSDMIPNNILAQYAQSLADELIDTAGNHYKIYVPINVNYTVTFISPDLSLKKWQFYGVKDEQLHQEMVSSIELLSQNPNKKLLWEGENICDWLIKNPQHEFIPTKAY